MKVGSLRNVTKTAPYYHDGRFKTLEETISDHVVQGVVSRCVEHIAHLTVILNLIQDLKVADSESSSE